MKYRLITIAAILLALLPGTTASGQVAGGQTTWTFSGHVAEGGTWEMRITASQRSFQPGDGLNLAVEYTINSIGLAHNIDRVNGVFTLVTGLRTFDGDGNMLGTTHSMGSTVLTGVGLPIEGESHGLPTTRFGSKFSSAIDSYMLTGPSDLYVDSNAGIIRGTAVHGILIDPDIPPGWYQLRVDLGLEITPGDVVTLWGVSPELDSTTEDEQTYAVAGPVAIGTSSQPQMIWTLFSSSIPGGGVVALEDKGYAAFTRGLGYCENPILPMLDSRGAQVRYLLEPDFPLVWNPFMRTTGNTLDLDYSSGWMEIRIQDPDGTIVDLGGAPFAAARGMGATTLQNKFEYSFSQYGRHRIELSGWIKDIQNQTYVGGGVYEVHVARPIQIEPNILSGTPFSKHDMVDPGFQLYPPVEADVEITWELDKQSRGDADEEQFTVTANRWGYYTPPLLAGRDRFARATQIQFDDAGEYKITYRATYREQDGTLWMGEKVLTGVVYDERTINLSSRPPASGSFAITSDARYIPVPADTGDTVLLPESTTSGLPTVYTFPIGFFLGDQIGFRTDDSALTELDIGTSSAFVTPGLATSSGLFPHAYPSDIDRKGYIVANASRCDGFLQSRVFEGSPFNHMPYASYPWFPGELSVDLAGDIYHIWTGMVYHDFVSNQTTYGRYSTGIVLSDDVNNPSVHQPGSRLVSDGWGTHDLLLHNPAVRPGSIVGHGTPFTPGAYFLPLPESTTVEYILTPPSGDQRTALVTADNSGYACDMGERIALDQEGVWRVDSRLIQGEAVGGLLGVQPGESWEFYVVGLNNDLPIKFHLPEQSPLDLNSNRVVLNGDLTAGEIHEGTVRISTTFNGAVVEQTERDFTEGAFVYSIDLAQVQNSYRNFDPASRHDRLVITFYADGLSEEGSHRRAAKMVFIQGGILYTMEKDYSDIEGRTREERLNEILRQAEVEAAREIRGREPVWEQGGE